MKMQSLLVVETDLCIDRMFVVVGSTLIQQPRAYDFTPATPAPTRHPPSGWILPVRCRMRLDPACLHAAACGCLQASPDDVAGVNVLDVSLTLRDQHTTQHTPNKQAPQQSNQPSAAATTHVTGRAARLRVCQSAGLPVWPPTRPSACLPAYVCLPACLPCRPARPPA